MQLAGITAPPLVPGRWPSAGYMQDFEKSLTGAAGAVLYLVERISGRELIKAGAHKYLMRKPTGKPSPKYRYWYKLPGRGIVTHDRPVEGSSYRAAHEGQEGHYHVLSSDDEGVFVRHSATGAHRKLSHDEFASEVNAQHAGTHKAASEGKRAEILQAIKVLHEGTGGPKQANRVRKLVDQAQEAGWLADKEAALYQQQAMEAGKHSTEQAELKQKAEKTATRQKVLAEVDAEGGGKQDGGLGLVGDNAVMFVSDPSGKPKKQQVKYRLVSVDQLIASHLPAGRFKENPAYPEGVQERTYHTNEASQRNVERNAKEIEPDFLINTNPDAANGAPIITPGGFVLGGNSRKMTLELAYNLHPDSAEKYKAMLRDKAKHFGFTAADVDKIKDPVLVREVEDPGTKEGRIDLVRKYNQSFTIDMNPLEEIVAKGKLLRPKKDKATGKMVDSATYKALEMLGKNEEGKDVDETFNDFLTSGRSLALIKAMRMDGLLDNVNQARYTKKNDPTKLNEEGRTFVSKALLGSVIDNVDDLEDMGQELRNQFNANLPVILAAGRNNKAFDLVPALHRAARLLANMKRAGMTNPTDAVRQDQMLDKEGQAVERKGDRLDSANPVWNDPLAQAVTLAVLGGKKAGPAFRNFARIAAQPSSAGGMFDDGPSDEDRAMEAMKQSFGFQTDSPFKEKQAADEAAAAEKGDKKYQAGLGKMNAELEKRGLATVGGGKPAKPTEKAPRKKRSDAGQSRKKAEVVA